MEGEEKARGGERREGERTGGEGEEDKRGEQREGVRPLS